MKSTVVFELLVIVNIVASDINSFIHTSVDLKESNFYNLQIEKLTWKNNPAGCSKSCPISDNTATRRVVKFDQKIGKCECFLNAKKDLFDSSDSAKIPNAVFLYPGNGDRPLSRPIFYQKS